MSRKNLKKEGCKIEGGIEREEEVQVPREIHGGTARGNIGGPGHQPEGDLGGSDGGPAEEISRGSARGNPREPSPRYSRRKGRKKKKNAREKHSSVKMGAIPKYPAIMPKQMPKKTKKPGESARRFAMVGKMKDRSSKDSEGWKQEKEDLEERRSSELEQEPVLGEALGAEASSNPGERLRPGEGVLEGV